MSEGFGPGGGSHVSRSVEALAEARVREASRPPDPNADPGRWPSLSMVLRTAAVLALGLIAAGWILSALNGLS